MKILFQGDSITDAGRDRSDCHLLGEGYPHYAAEYIKLRFPDENFEFMNLGISGDRTENLVARLQSDFIDINPDVTSIHIGINDTWHRAESLDWLPDDIFETQYRTVLESIRKNTDSKIIMIEQFLLPAPDKLYFREDLNGKIDITRKLAREYADVYVPLDGIMAKACVGTPYTHWSDDGVHPNKNGAEYIGMIYTEAFEELMGKIK